MALLISSLQITGLRRPVRTSSSDSAAQTHLRSSRSILGVLSPLSTKWCALPFPAAAARKTFWEKTLSTYHVETEPISSAYECCLQLSWASESPTQRDSIMTTDTVFLLYVSHFSFLFFLPLAHLSSHLTCYLIVVSTTRQRTLTYAPCCHLLVVPSPTYCLVMRKRPTQKAMTTHNSCQSCHVLPYKK